MKPSLRTFLGALHTFGGVVAFYAALWLLGPRPAVAATVAFVALDGAWRLLSRKPMPLIWLVSNGMALAFGSVGLLARTPSMILYEGPITNALVGGFFLAGAFGRKPLVAQFAEQSGRFRLPEDRPELVAFFRALTGLWALYFLVKAAAFLWLGLRYPLGQALALRASLGWTSFAIMMLVSLQGRRVFGLCRRVGLFRPPRARAVPSRGEAS